LREVAVGAFSVTARCRPSATSSSKRKLKDACGRSQAQELDAIDGLGDDEVGRLVEEAIGNMHALPLCATPRLHLSTPFSLERICEWQDQAILYARLGATRARAFQQQLGVCDHAVQRGPSPPSERSVTCPGMGRQVARNRRHAARPQRAQVEEKTWGEVLARHRRASDETP
jgi:hypothetical protein